MSSSLTGGVWKKDSVKDVAESLGITTLPDEVAEALAGDVEFRLWEIIQESIKFMQHSRRTKLKVEDVDHALKVRNLEPLWGFASTTHIPYKKTVTGTGTVYHLADEEIDLSKVLKMEMPTVPRDISFTAHWLAIEGVQPLIKENPTPQELAKYAPKINAGPANITTASSTITPLVKHVLSRELQLYFTRLTEALNTSTGTGASDDLRDAALGSLRSDPGLHQLVPYLIGWGGDQISNNLGDLAALQRSLDLYHAMLDNPTLFVEPYLHQLTPPILTCLLTTALPPVPTTAPISPHSIRSLAASLLHLILERFSASYASLRPRITKTLLRGLGAEHRGLSARWGAARGLKGLVGEGGNTVISEWIGLGMKKLAEMVGREPEAEAGERELLVQEVFDVLHASLLPLTEVVALDKPSPIELEGVYGTVFGPVMFARWEEGGKEIHARYGAVTSSDGDAAMQQV